MRSARHSTRSSLFLLLVWSIAPGLLAATVPVQQHAEARPNTATASALPIDAKQSEVLDRIVAVVDEHAILASDVDEEMRFIALQSVAEPKEDNTPQRALDRVIDRTLINEQRALQPGIAEIPQKQVDKSVAEFRQSIPACANDNCKTDAAWQAVLEAHGFTPAEVESRIRERLAILKFIDLRFGVAIRVPNAAIQHYYDNVLKPELLRTNTTLPDLSAVAPRIREVLRQQQISALVDQWVKGLHGEEHVRILDTAYGNGESGQ